MNLLPWPKHSTFNKTFDIYVKYVSKHYGEKVTITFDGYENGSSFRGPTHLLAPNEDFMTG